MAPLGRTLTPVYNRKIVQLLTPCLLFSLHRLPPPTACQSLRLEATASNYQGETRMLHPTRNKEVHLREHFEDKMFGAAFMRERRAAAVKVGDASSLSSPYLAPI